jgi:hypothetical protein
MSSWSGTYLAQGKLYKSTTGLIALRYKLKVGRDLGRFLGIGEISYKTFVPEEV